MTKKINNEQYKQTKWLITVIIKQTLFQYSDCINHQFSAMQCTINVLHPSNMILKRLCANLCLGTVIKSPQSQALHSTERQFLPEIRWFFMHHYFNNQCPCSISVSFFRRWPLSLSVWGFKVVCGLIGYIATLLSVKMRKTTLYSAT